MMSPSYLFWAADISVNSMLTLKIQTCALKTASAVANKSAPFLDSVMKQTPLQNVKLAKKAIHK